MRWLRRILERRSVGRNYAGGWGVELAVYRNAALVYAHGYRYLWHDGAIGGFQTVNATFPDDGIDIVILTNDGTGLGPVLRRPGPVPTRAVLDRCAANPRARVSQRPCKRVRSGTTRGTR